MNHLSNNLFCKPYSSSLRILYSNQYPEINGAISFRSLNLKEDLKMIHEWVHQEYAHEYWQMNGYFSQLVAIYQCMERNPFSHSFIGLLNNTIVCQFDVYSVSADELKEHIHIEKHDCGFHLLMAPLKNRIPGLTPIVIKAFLDHYFSFSEAERMYAEPDITNQKSIVLLERCGFKKVKRVEMSYKTADVYCLERKDHFNPSTSSG